MDNAMKADIKYIAKWFAAMVILVNAGMLVIDVYAFAMSLIGHTVALHVPGTIITRLIYTTSAAILLLIACFGYGYISNTKNIPTPK